MDPLCDDLLNINESLSCGDLSSMIDPLLDPLGLYADFRSMTYYVVICPGL